MAPERSPTRDHRPYAYANSGRRAARRATTPPQGLGAGGFKTLCPQDVLPITVLVSTEVEHVEVSQLGDPHHYPGAEEPPAGADRTPFLVALPSPALTPPPPLPRNGPGRPGPSPAPCLFPMKSALFLKAVWEATSMTRCGSDVVFHQQ